MEFIEYNKCTTCKKAKKFLCDNNISFIDRNIKDNNPSFEEISLWIKKYNIPIKKLFNTSGLKYKELNLKDKLDYMSDIEKIKILSSDGMLIKRPILVDDNNILIGFKIDEWSKFCESTNN